MLQIKYEILEHLGVLSESGGGWQKEVNIISWNGRPAKLDIREWSPEHNRMSNGVTLTADELRALIEIAERSGIIETEY